MSAWQVRAHTQRLSTQRSRGERVHGVSHPQVGVQRPATQTAPGSHVTPAQGLATQRPSAHTSVLAQVTPSQGERGKHRTWHAKPSSQGPGHGVMRAQRPVASSQNCPAEHVTPEHGAGKHPDTQRPAKHVSCGPQRTPAQRSRTGTQRISQRSVPHGVSAARHTSSAQLPCRQRRPREQSRSVTHSSGAPASGVSRAVTSRGGVSKVGASSFGPTGMSLPTVAS